MVQCECKKIENQAISGKDEYQYKTLILIYCFICMFQMTAVILGIDW